MEGDPDALKVAMTENTEKPPDDSAWYLLATLYGQPKERELYGQPDERDEELQGRNRVAWNRCMASELSEKLRATLIQVGRYSAAELTPFSEEELQAVELDFAERSRSSCTTTRIADLISGDIDFSNTEIGYLNAAKFIFPKRAKFGGATFSRAADFSGATFCERADFGRATFSGAADFRGAAFSAEAVFKEAAVADLSDIADFEHATFSDEVYFEGATFADVAYFREANFDLQRAYFAATIFSADANFQGAIFSGGADFRGCRFCKATEFERATFSDEADFRDATFVEPAHFVGATFPGITDIGAGIVDFRGATFCDDVDFEAATFSGRAYFVTTTFKRSVYFINAKMESETRFTSAAFTSEPPEFFGAKLHEGTVWRDATWPDPPRDAATAGRFVDAYERLKLEMDRLKKHEDELDFFARELQCRSVLLGYWREISKLRIFG
jgi:uncharacterized protein YjbI with pentapeptide repeats